VSENPIETSDVLPPAPPPLVETTGAYELADGVWVIPDRRINLVPNIGIILGEDAALVVDTAMGPGNAARVLEKARELAGDRRLLLTLTHFHPEHGYGAQVFRSEATILYNRAQLEELREKGAPYLELFRGFGPDVARALEDVELVEPHVVYDGGADVDLGGRRVELRSWGLAHTRGDQVAFLPDERILFAGDLVENRFFPIFPWFPPEDADVNGSRWIEVLERLEGLEPATVVPGHGEVGDVSLVAGAREYIAALRDDVRRSGAPDADALVAELEPRFRARYPEWDNPEWIAFAIRCLRTESVAT